MLNLLCGPWGARFYVCTLPVADSAWRSEGQQGHNRKKHCILIRLEHFGECLLCRQLLPESASAVHQRPLIPSLKTVVIHSDLLMREMTQVTQFGH